MLCQLQHLLLGHLRIRPQSVGQPVRRTPTGGHLPVQPAVWDPGLLRSGAMRRWPGVMCGGRRHCATNASITCGASSECLCFKTVDNLTRCGRVLGPGCSTCTSDGDCETLRPNVPGIFCAQRTGAPPVPARWDRGSARRRAKPRNASGSRRSKPAGRFGGASRCSATAARNTIVAAIDTA